MGDAHFLFWFLLHPATVKSVLVVAIGMAAAVSLLLVIRKWGDYA